MLTIVDLHWEEELSSSKAAKVVGGMDCGKAIDLANLAIECSKACIMIGQSSEGAALAGMAQGLMAGACSK